jgi:DNA-binding LytR/AlgR family response regulator
MTMTSESPSTQDPQHLTAIIADDEALMRANLREQLALAWPELEIVAEATDGDEAVALVAEHHPDIAFLDIRMPGRTGLDAALDITQSMEPGGHETRIVFVTAYEQHALQAFEAGAVDYLLKPIEPARLQQTIERIRKSLRTAAPAAASEGLEGLLADLRRSIRPADARYMKWIKATIGRDLRLLNVDDVVYFQSDTKYTRVVLAQSEALIRTPLKELLSGLDPEKFWQIHRGTLVNVEAIAAVSRDGPEKQSVHLKGRNEKLPVSRQFFHLFRQM